MAAALALVEVAAHTGANAVKFQYWSDPLQLAARRRLPPETYQRFQVLPEWLSTLSRAAKDQGIQFMCTVYLSQDITTVMPWISRFKVASFEAVDFGFLRAHPAKAHLVISTGMCNLRELNRLRDFQSAYMGASGIVNLLHCVSAYPAPVTEMNLVVIRAFGLDGLSDHSGNPCMGAWAVYAGAHVIEVHMRLDETPEDNPDFPHAHAPHELGTYIKGIRNAEMVMGIPRKALQVSEWENLRHRVVLP